MCIIIMRPAGATAPDEATMRRCWKANSDGAGFMWADGTQLIIEKGLMTFERFLERSQYIPEHASCAYHFRIGTNGANTAVNTHPWPIDRQTALVHNGVIGGLADDRDVSDSMRFAMAIRGIPWWNTDNVDMRWLIQSALGSYNKVVILRDSGAYFIANEGGGIWDNGCWYSNAGFRAPIVYESTPAPYVHQESLFPDALLVKYIHYGKRKGLVYMTTKSGRAITMAAQDFARHYTIYDFVSPELTQKADMIAVSIMDAIDSAEADL